MSLHMRLDLASFAAQCAQLGWLDCKTPSFVSTSAMRHNRIISVAALVPPVSFRFMTLALYLQYGELEKIKAAPF